MDSQKNEPYESELWGSVMYVATANFAGVIGGQCYIRYFFASSVGLINLFS